MHAERDLVLDPNFWARRLKHAKSERVVHHALFRCSDSIWTEIENEHRHILMGIIGENDSILDVGCAWGRLLNLLPAHWKGTYVGVDLSPEFIAIARKEHPDSQFIVGNIEDVTTYFAAYEFTWSVMISVRHMISVNISEKYWSEILDELERVSRKRLYLEYDAEDKGTIE